MTDYQNRLARMGTRGKLVEFCPKCGKRYVGDESKAGTSVKCQKLTCGHTFVLPGHRRTTGPGPRPRPKPKTSALKTVLVSLISLLAIGSIVLGTVLLIKKNKTGPTPKKIVKPVGPGPQPVGDLAKLPVKQMVCRVVPGVKIVRGGQTIERSYDWYNDPTPLEVRSLSPWEKKHVLKIFKDGSMAMATPAGHGSGFLITSDGYILTNQHVVEYAWEMKKNPEYLERFRVHQGHTSIKPQVYVLFDGKSYEAEMVHVSVKFDMAVLKATGITGGTPFQLSASNDVPQISDIWVLGFPGEAERASLGAEEKRKRIEKMRKHRLIKDAFDDNQLTLNSNKGAIGKIRESAVYGRIIQTDCQMTFGNSGGPSVTPNGIVRGIATWGLKVNEDKDKDGKPDAMNTTINAAQLLLPMRGEIDGAVKGEHKVKWIANPDKK